MEIEKSFPTVLVRPGEANRLIGGHPWIYQGNILRLTRPAKDGDVVQVKDHRQRFLGVGLYNSQSKIKVRLLAAGRVALDQGFFEERFRRALALRRKHLPQCRSFRALNSEGDFLSGLIVDQYEDTLVVQISSLGLEQRKPIVLEALKNVFQPAGILERSDLSGRTLEGLAPVSGPLFGHVPDSLDVELNGLKFNVDLGSGHKTGLYLDQQVNYREVGRFAQGARVLDCFSFTGGFALHAARAGASHVLALEQSAVATAQARRNADLNHLAGSCAFETVNVFDWLKEETARLRNDRGEAPFDLIILDPPSFTRNRAAVADALRGYKEIHLRALKLLKPGGTLATFCCSHHVDAVTFQQVIVEAAFDARRVLRRIECFQQSPDHPVLPAIPETEYLKGFVFETA